MILRTMKLQKLHPTLLVHQQVSFDFKFDSIKSTIDQPITPLAFLKN
jgi:hypothetical protein